MYNVDSGQKGLPLLLCSNFKAVASSAELMSCLRDAEEISPLHHLTQDNPNLGRCGARGGGLVTVSRQSRLHTPSPGKVA